MQFIVKTGTACNFACVYCSEGQQAPQMLSEETFCKFIDDVPALLEERDDPCVEILWHGGEPLLWGHDLLARAMEYAEQRLAGCDVEFLMQTNGYLIDDRFLALFQRHRVNIGVSLDGWPELHDKNRPTKDGEGTFAVVWRNVQRIREAGLGGSILMVLNTAEPLDADRLFAFIEDNGIICKINPLIPCGRAADRTDARQIYKNYVELMKKLYEKAVQSEKEIVIDPLDKLMDALLTGGALAECSYNGHCSEDMMCLYPDGAVGLCGRDGEREQLAYGSVLEKDLLTLFHSPMAQKIRMRDAFLQENDCADCRDWQLCHGGCTFEALNARGVIEACFSWCEERKGLLQYLRTTGLQLLKKRLVRQKREQRLLLSEKRRIWKEAAQYAR